MKIAPKKRGRFVGLGSVNDVPRARADHAARREDQDSDLRRDLAAANNVIAQHNDKFKAMASFCDLMMTSSSANADPIIASAWNTLRATLNTERTPEEQADLERRVEQNSSDLANEMNLNSRS